MGTGSWRLGYSRDFHTWAVEGSSGYRVLGLGYSGDLYSWALEGSSGYRVFGFRIFRRSM